MLVQLNQSSKMDLSIRNFLFVLLFFNSNLIQLNLADDDVGSIYLLLELVWLLTIFDWQVEYDIYYDKMETFNGTCEFFEYKFDVVKKDEKQNIFTVDSTLQIKQDITNDIRVRQMFSFWNTFF